MDGSLDLPFVGGGQKLESGNFVERWAGRGVPLGLSVEGFSCGAFAFRALWTWGGGGRARHPRSGGARGVEGGATTGLGTTGDIWSTLEVKECWHQRDSGGADNGVP